MPVNVFVPHAAMTGNGQMLFRIGPETVPEGLVSPRISHLGPLPRRTPCTVTTNTHRSFVGPLQIHGFPREPSLRGGARSSGVRADCTPLFGHAIQGTRTSTFFPRLILTWTAFPLCPTTSSFRCLDLATMHCIYSCLIVNEL